MGRGFKGFNRKSEGFLPWEQAFAYTGGVQSVVVPHTALYKLEVWGASGGRNGGNGGYSIGYKKLSKGTTLYICVGGQGGTSSEGGIVWTSVAYGGYNGGGNGSCGQSAIAGAGGGATHIALVTGTLAGIGKTSFVNNGNGLIVAGGGAGGADTFVGGYGGSGGGTNGGDGSGQGSGYNGSGGTQTSGAGFGQGGSGSMTFDDTYFRQVVGGGGGGFYGGHGGHTDGMGGGGASARAGGGGSGWTGGTPQITYRGRVYTPIMYNGSSAGHGKAKITLVK